MKKSPLVMTSWIELRLLGVMALCLCGTALGQRPGTSDVQLGQQGFACLFNGKDLTGWEGRPEAWEVRDGAIWCTGKEATRNWLVWRGGQPRDFELRLHFKYVKGLFSGMTDEDGQHATGAGVVALQDHGRGTIVGFKDVWLKRRDDRREILESDEDQAGRRKHPEDGFDSLFDGRTLDGWHAVPPECATDWSVDEGVIVGRGSADRLAYLAWKDQRLTDFELRLQYRLPGEGNTGVEIRSQPDSTGKRPFKGYHADLGHVGIGPHILGAWDFHFAQRQEYPCPRGTRLVIDEQGRTQSSTIDGALTAADVRPRTWNDVRIVARGKHFQFFINGKLASEFTDKSTRGRLDHGAIALQIHDQGMRVEFRDIRLRKAP